MKKIKSPTDVVKAAIEAKAAYDTAATVAALAGR